MNGFACYFDCAVCDHTAIVGVEEAEPDGWQYDGGDWFCPDHDPDDLDVRHLTSIYSKGYPNDMYLR